ncbi:MAG: DUF1552 domain-containing protein, partial [Myxococcales bacterium]|nr:DUF1552 domain-containing protein [Myxococcales bacterium]
GVFTGFGAADGGNFYPTSAGPLVLTPDLEALAPHVDDLTMINGLTYSAISNTSGSHGHASALLTGRGVIATGQNGNTPMAAGPSVDQIAGDRLGLSTQLRSFAAVAGPNDDEVYFSWSDAMTPNPAVRDPLEAFNLLFSNVGGQSQDAALAIARKKSILDFAASDIEKLQGRLGAADKARLDQHLSSIREMEQKLTGTVSAACVKPEAPSATFSDPLDDSEHYPGYCQLMTDLVVMALRCDVTHVAFLSLGPSQNYRIFSHLGVTTDYHAVAHGSIQQSDPALAQDYYRRITRFHMEQFAYFMAALKGDGQNQENLLDRSAVVALSEFSAGERHEDTYLPVFAAGKLGGMQGGRNLVFPCDMPQSFQEASWCASLSGTANRCINDVWQSALEATGAFTSDEKFGDETLPTKPLEGLWTA